MGLPLTLHRLLVGVEQKTGVPILPRDRILSAVSQDGLHWEREAGFRVDVEGSHGSEMVYWPHAVQMPDGWRLYFFGSSRSSDGWRGRILSARSSDGINFTVEPGERISADGPHDSRFAAAPWVVAVPDGYRMYYAGSTDGLTWCILSAVSTDGLHWTKEDGIRLAPQRERGDTGLTSPCVAFIENQLRMYVTVAREDGSCINWATSSDGITWSVLSGVYFSSSGSAFHRYYDNPRIVPSARGWRMYMAGHDGSAIGVHIYSAITRDGFHWDWEPGSRLEVYKGVETNFCHPVLLQDGRWRMYFTGYWGRHLLSPLTRWQHRKR